MTTTAWGAATLVEEVCIKQTAEGRAFATRVELLESHDGELVRFAYSTGGASRRGPVTLRPRDLQQLRKALAKTPRLREALALLTTSR